MGKKRAPSTSESESSDDYGSDSASESDSESGSSSASSSRSSSPSRSSTSESRSTSKSTEHVPVPIEPDTIDPADADKYITIVVKDPVKHGENVNAYVSYTVSSTTNLPLFQSGAFSVVRRYSDWEWVFIQLSLEFPGCIIPPVPEKSALGRFGPRFVEERRRHLELFLNNVGSNPILRKSKYFRVFLEAPPSLFDKERSKTKKINMKELGLNIESATKVLSWLGGSIKDAAKKVAKSFRPVGEMDEQYSRTLEHMMNMVEHFSVMEKAVSTIVDSTVAMRDSMTELSAALTLIGHQEKNELQGAFTSVAATVERAGKQYSDMSGKLDLLFFDPIKEYSLYFVSILQTLKTREMLADDLFTSKNNLQTAKANRGKSDSASVIKKAKKHVAKVEKDLSVMNQRIKGEVLKFNEKKYTELKKVLLDMLLVYRDYNVELEELYKDLVMELEEIDVAEMQRSSSVSAEKLLPLPEEVAKKERAKDKKDKERKQKKDKKRAESNVTDDKEEEPAAAVENKEEEKEKEKEEPSAPAPEDPHPEVGEPAGEAAVPSTEGGETVPQ